VGEGVVFEKLATLLDVALRILLKAPAEASVDAIRRPALNDVRNIR